MSVPNPHPEDDLIGLLDIYLEFLAQPEVKSNPEMVKLFLKKFETVVAFYKAGFNV